MSAKEQLSIIECDADLYCEISSTLQFALSGKPVFYTDSLADLVNRHCPELYDLAEENGFRFIPSNDMSELEQTPPDIRFDVIRITEPN